MHENNHLFHYSTLVHAINAAYKKLSNYYQQTANNLGNYYNLSNILNPSYKVTTFESDMWGPKLAAKYKQDFLNPLNKDHVTLILSFVTPNRGTATSYCHALLAQTSTQKRPASLTTYFEAEQYRSKGKA